LLVCGEERLAEAAARISDAAPRGAPRTGESLTS
jgi:hypothetical protein